MEFIFNDLFFLALLSCIFLSLLSSPLGVFLTLKKMSLMGDAISHSLLPGMAIALIFFGFSSIGFLIGGLISGVIILILMHFLSKKTVFKDDGILAMIYLVMSSLGIIIIAKAQIKIDLMHLLFGNLLLIPIEWLWLLGFMTLLILPVFYSIRKSLSLILVDPEYSRFLKINETKVKNIFYFLVLLVLILSFYAVGTMLALGFMVIPAMIAKLFSKNINQQIKTSILISIVMSFIGILVSFIYNIPTGPGIIISGGGIFILVLIFSTVKDQILN
ncbi:MAG: metal ABC transporter permease [Bdellovibrionaceae bacterium]|nr:metal ABC transporter permease [Pseudobdellovibrionaceae bacterium]